MQRSTRIPDEWGVVQVVGPFSVCRTSNEGSRDGSWDSYLLQLMNELVVWYQQRPTGGTGTMRSRDV
jgi:hypothetical protein